MFPSKNSFLSDTFITKLENQVIGVYVLLALNEHDIELKNIAINENFQRLGISKLMLGHACETAKAGNFGRLIIGTGNSGIGELYFYQKQGFEIYAIKKNFFLENYAKPIAENGIQDKHILMLEKCLQPF